MRPIKSAILLFLACIALLAQHEAALVNIDGEAFESVANSTELVSLRTTESKTFLNSDGTKTSLIRAGSMHYVDETGLYRDIELTPVESQLDKIAFENTTNTLKCFFPEFGGLSDGVAVEYEGKRINIAKDLSVKFLRKGKALLYESLYPQSPVSEGNCISYDISPNIRLDYDILVDKLEQKIILRECPDDFDQIVIEEIISIPTDWSLESMGAEDHIALKDESDEVAFVFPKPFIHDASGSRRHEAPSIEYEIEELVGAYALRMIIDSEWLCAADREYPVTIDPTVTLYADYLYSTGFIEHLVYDYIYNYHSNYGSYNAEIYVGSFNDDFIGWYAIERGWAEFSIGGIPGGADITNTVLYANCRTYSVIGGPPFYLQLYEMDIQPSTSGASSVYGDIGSHTMYSGGNYINYTGLYTFDLGTSADADLEGAGSWFAVGFKQQDESGYSWCEGAFHGNPSASRPYLEVTYSGGTAGSWIGVVSSDWNTGGNWGDGLVPTSSVDVTIPNASTTPHDPTISASANCRNMLIESGGVVNGGSGTLNCYGNWTNNGTMNGASSTVIFSSSGSQTISGTTQPNFYNVRLNKPSGTLYLGRNINVSGELDITYAGNPNRFETGGYKIDFTP